MMLFRFILRTCRGMMLLTFAAALLSGACNAGLIYFVTEGLTISAGPTTFIIWGFVALGLGKVATHFLSQALLASFSQGAIAELRRDLIRKILGVPLRDLEEIGTARILVALTDDVFNITQALLAIPLVSVNLAILLGGTAYLGWLSWQILLSACVVILIGAIGYRWMIASAFRCLNEAREEEDRLFGFFRALTEGIKELKLHRSRRGEFFSERIQKSTERYQRYNVAAELRFVGAQSWSHLLYFALIGFILFLIPVLSPISEKTLTGYVVATLYLMGPLAGVLSSFSLFGRANVALQKVESLGLSLAEHSSEECPVPAIADKARDNGASTKPALSASAAPAFEVLELSSIVHSYHREQDDSSFVLGPINLALRPAEIVFIVGGNGSGKSTLAKIITGLYIPEAGEIRLDGQIITNKNRDDYRQLFSAVFADFYLFQDFMGIKGGNLDNQARQYLKRLHLHHKVQVQNGVLSTTSVSQGQRKRLALLTSYLEDRPLYLFDEWASDQDPYFKNIFYTEILPELKARGKCVVVITHDDRYFGLADRVIKLDYGRLVPFTEHERPAFDSILQIK